MKHTEFLKGFDACVGHVAPESAIRDAVNYLINTGATRSRAVFEKWKRETTFAPGDITRVEKELYG